MLLAQVIVHSPVDAFARLKSESEQLVLVAVKRLRLFGAVRHPVVEPQYIVHLVAGAHTRVIKGQIATPFSWSSGPRAIKETRIPLSLDDIPPRGNESGWPSRLTIRPHPETLPVGRVTGDSWMCASRGAPYVRIWEAWDLPDRPRETPSRDLTAKIAGPAWPGRPKRRSQTRCRSCPAAAGRAPKGAH